MDLYPWIVFLHVAGILLFFMAHGTSMAVGNPMPAAVVGLGAFLVILWLMFFKPF